MFIVLLQAGWGEGARSSMLAIVAAQGTAVQAGVPRDTAGVSGDPAGGIGIAAVGIGSAAVATGDGGVGSGVFAGQTQVSSV